MSGFFAHTSNCQIEHLRAEQHDRRAQNDRHPPATLSPSAASRVSVLGTTCRVRPPASRVRRGVDRPSSPLDVSAVSITGLRALSFLSMPRVSTVARARRDRIDAGTASVACGVSAAHLDLVDSSSPLSSGRVRSVGHHRLRASPTVPYWRDSAPHDAVRGGSGCRLGVGRFCRARLPVPDPCATRRATHRALRSDFRRASIWGRQRARDVRGPRTPTRQAPQRTRPAAAFSCDSVTRNRVRHVGHCVISGSNESSATRSDSFHHDPRIAHLRGRKPELADTVPSRRPRWCSSNPDITSTPPGLTNAVSTGASVIRGPARMFASTRSCGVVASSSGAKILSRCEATPL